MPTKNQQTHLHHSPRSVHRIINYPNSPYAKSQTYYYKGSSVFRLSNIEFKTRILKAVANNPLNIITFTTILNYYGDKDKHKEKFAILNHLYHTLQPVIAEYLQAPEHNTAVVIDTEGETNV